MPLRFLSALLLLSLACSPLACSSGSGSSGQELTALGPDSGAGCDSHVTGRCSYADGVCAEYSGDVLPTGIPNPDPDDCKTTGGTYAQAACARTGVLGSCVRTVGNNVNTEGPGKVCDYYVTTWLPAAYDAGVTGDPCFNSGGTFAPAP